MRTVWRWELVKLASLTRVRLVLAACLLGPFALAVGLRAQGQTPSDTLFGRWVGTSGFALPLVVLGFSGQWLLPLLVSLVAGDALAGEDQLGTWSTIAIRGRSRLTLLAGKAAAALTWSTLVVVVLAVASLLAGLATVGSQPLVGLSGTLLPARTATAMVLASWATALLPAAGFACLALALSAASRHSALGIGAPAVLGLVMQLVAFVPGIDPIRHLLLSTPFEAWHGLVRTGPYYGPLGTGALVCAGWAAGALVVAAVLLRRREFAHV